MEFIEDISKVPFKDILSLYKSVGWKAYTDNPEKLKTAFEKSTYTVFIYVEQCLVGLGRSISDDVSIHYLQDILVSPDFQGKGYGKKIINRCLNRFSQVRTHIILTDNEERQKLFYESIGYKNTKDLKETTLNVFVKMTGVELK